MLKRVWCRVFGHAKPITYKVRQGGFHIGPEGQGPTDSVQWECPRCGGQAHAISLRTSRPHRVKAANRIESRR